MIDDKNSMKATKWEKIPFRIMVILWFLSIPLAGLSYLWDGIGKERSVDSNKAEQAWLACHQSYRESHPDCDTNTIAYRACTDGTITACAGATAHMNFLAREEKEFKSKSEWAAISAMVTLFASTLVFYLVRFVLTGRLRPFWIGVKE